MYIQCSRVKRKGKDGRNRKLVEAYRDPKTGSPRNRTVQKLEKLPILERARIIYKYGGQRHLGQEEWLAMQTAGDFDGPAASCRIGDSYAGAGTAVLLHYLKTTDMHRTLTRHLGNKYGRLVRDMIIQQIVRPGSKLSYASQRKSSLSYLLDGKEEADEDTLYRSMNELEKSFPAIRDDLNGGLSRPNKLLFYDLSNSYFTGTKAELGGYGQSKEKRYDRYIVSYGLVVNQGDVPLDIKVWKGGTADARTVSSAFKDWKDRFGANQAIWIADRSMSGQDNLEEIKESGLSYITGMPAGSEHKLLSDLHEQSPGLFDQPLTEIVQGDTRYVICRHYAKGYHRENLHYKRRRKVYENLKKIKRSPQNKSQNKLYHRCMRLLEENEQTDCWQISIEPYQDQKDQTRYRLEFQLNRNRALVKNILGHYYVLQTDLKKEELDKEAVKQSYQSLFKIERCFRICKSHLDIRPIRHWKAARIKAHIYLNYLSLWLTKQIENGWRQRGQTQEVVLALREWDCHLRLNEILDETGRLIEWQWNKGKRCGETVQQIKEFGEWGHIKPDP